MGQACDEAENFDVDAVVGGADVFVGAITIGVFGGEFEAALAFVGGIGLVRGFAEEDEMARVHEGDVGVAFSHAVTQAALEGKVDTEFAVALDTGCVWGGELTMLRLDDWMHICVSCS